jgi:hypothetical protein
MIEARAQNGRRPARIFRRPKDNNRIGRVQFLLAGFMDDAKAGDRHDKSEQQSYCRQRPQRPISA